MADKKISALTASTTPLAGTEVLPIVQSGATVKVAVSDLTAGRAISATQLTLSTGNLIVGTAAKGIDFSANANAPGMTSELLTWYEVGTWTGTLTATTPPTVPVTATGRYTRVGNQVTVAIEFENVSTVGAGGGLEVTGLPFTAVSSGYGPAMKSGLGVQAVTAGIYGGLSKVIFSDSGTMNNTPIVAGLGVYLRFSATYFM